MKFKSNPDHPMNDKPTGISRLTLQWALIALCIPGIASSLRASEPSWWRHEGNPPVITGGPSQNDGIANIGQAKWMVSEALRVIEDIDAPVAQLIRDDLDSVVDLAIPEPLPPGWHESQKAPLLIGQLKALARPFYVRLNDRTSVWVRSQLHQNGLSLLGGDYFQDSAGRYLPWNPATPLEDNLSPANIGQLKLVFSLRFRQDTDLDGIPDYWEYAYGLDPFRNDADEDANGDGITNYQHFLAGTDPFFQDPGENDAADNIEPGNDADHLASEQFDPFDGSVALVLTPLWQ